MVELSPYVREIYEFRKHYESNNPDDMTMHLTIKEINRRFIQDYKVKELRALCDRVSDR